MSVEDRSRLMAEGRAAFNRGEFFRAHELWEEVWLRAVGADRRWLQGLIQVAAGLHQLARGRPAQAARLLERAESKLGDAPDRLDGIEIAVARDGAERIRAAIARDEPADPSSVTLP